MCDFVCASVGLSICFFLSLPFTKISLKSLTLNIITADFLIFEEVKLLILIVDVDKPAVNKINSLISINYETLPVCVYVVMYVTNRLKKLLD